MLWQLAHVGTGHTGKDWNLNSYVDIGTDGDTRGIDIGPDNDNKNTDSLDTMLTFGGLAVDGCHSNLMASS